MISIFKDAIEKLEVGLQLLEVVACSLEIGTMSCVMVTWFLSEYRASSSCSALAKTLLRRLSGLVYSWIPCFCGGTSRVDMRIKKLIPSQIKRGCSQRLTITCGNKQYLGFSLFITRSSIHTANSQCPELQTHRNRVGAFKRPYPYQEHHITACQLIIL
jgi:hypothetical protein